MGNWITVRAFAIAFCLMLIVQVDRLMTAGFSATGVMYALVVSAVGGLFWGAIGLLIYRRFVKK